jgi:hypothetical protein
LHRADYDRKPRGGPEVLPAYLRSDEDLSVPVRSG